jgi:hypothetical protein
MNIDFLEAWGATLLIICLLAIVVAIVGSIIFLILHYVGGRLDKRRKAALDEYRKQIKEYYNNLH